jgi:hypothetical protein
MQAEQEEEDERRRACPRAKVMLSASLATDSGTVAVRIRNISEFGALIEGYPLPARDKRVTLKRLALGAAARVAWSRGTSCGLEFDEPVVPACWLDAPPRPPGAVSTGQSRVDAIQAAIRGGVAPVAPPQPAVTERPGDADLDRRIAEELAHIQRLLETIGGELAGEPLVVNRHGAALQQFDLAGQVLAHLARIVAARDKAAAVDAVGMAELRARLTRKKL